MSSTLVGKTGNKAKLYTWVEKLFEKLFYESGNKRNDIIDKSKLSSLSGSSKAFLEDLYDHFEKNRAIYLTAFKDEFNKMPETTEDKIYTITSNHFGGFGRTAPPQSKITTLPFPPNDVINDLIKVFMDSKRKQEIVDLAKQLGILEK
jgi:hypothetical protein